MKAFSGINVDIEQKGYQSKFPSTLEFEHISTFLSKRFLIFQQLQQTRIQKIR